MQELIDHTKNKFGLHSYYLANNQFFRRVNTFNETIYTLSMEWYPNHVVKLEDDLNPEGTASIEINLNQNKIENVIFVNGKSYAENGIIFSHSDKENIIKWIENETALTYGEQFRLEKEDEGELIFKACVNGVSIFPPGSIELKFDNEGKLTCFSIFGQFPTKEQVKEEKYTLSLDQVQPLAMKQLKFIEMPSFEQNQLLPIYAIEEVFVLNIGKMIIPYHFFADIPQFLEFNQTICWENEINIPFERKEMKWIENLTAEQAFSLEPSPDSFPITKEEQKKCIMAVKTFFQQEYPTESGKWILKNLYRDHGYIHATLKAKQQDERVFQRKIKIMIDPKSYEAVNYIDGKEILGMLDSFQTSSNVSVTKKEAYQKLKELLELKPYYVYDFQLGQYVLCGKLDCHYGVNASTGEVIALDAI